MGIGARAAPTPAATLHVQDGVVGDVPWRHGLAIAFNGIEHLCRRDEGILHRLRSRLSSLFAAVATLRQLGRQMQTDQRCRHGLFQIHRDFGRPFRQQVQGKWSATAG